jgi:hypothetical protein
MARQAAGFVLADRLAVDRERAPFAEHEGVACVEAAELIARFRALVPTRR